MRRPLGGGSALLGFEVFSPVRVACVACVCYGVYVAESGRFKAERSC